MKLYLPFSRDKSTLTVDLKDLSARKPLPLLDDILNSLQ